jgi:hypothetical protein
VREVSSSAHARWGRRILEVLENGLNLISNEVNTVMVQASQ